MFSLLAETYDGISQPVTYCHTLSIIFCLKSHVYSTIMFLISLPKKYNPSLSGMKWQLENGLGSLQVDAFTTV